MSNSTEGALGQAELQPRDLIWILGSCSAIARQPFDAQLLLQQFPPPHVRETAVRAARAMGFAARMRTARATDLHRYEGSFALLRSKGEQDPRVGMIVTADAESVHWIPSGTNETVSQPLPEFSARFAGQVIEIRRAPQPLQDADGAIRQGRFGFSWFIPELLKHRKVWRDVLLASLLLQLLALGLPLFTQVIIDKVVVHQTESTLVAIGIGMGIFLIASATLTWVRQYLVLHTGNRVDAVLASSVFNHLLRLPPRYFEHRPTGVIAARLQGVETIREFMSSAAVTLVLDVPFLLIAVAVMLYYSVPLTALALGILVLISGLCIAVAPVFRERLNEQFLLGARNQAFVTEYVAGMETVKSLQMEPQLQARFGDYLASYLHSSFRTRQIGNTYNVAATTLEQIMTMLILLGGAWIVMHPVAGSAEVFTIGMLVAFQMFAGKLSQPLMRLVGLWQQFQQSRLAVERLGDVLNAPSEPYSLAPNRKVQGLGRIQIEGLAFRYEPERPFLYENLDFEVPAGKTIAIMGPSGCGKSTLAKLLQGFYQPASGTIRVDGIDVRHLSANELRASFGVVPQDAVLFSGTIYDNLVMANPHASFEQIVQACRMAEIHAAIEALPQGYQTPIGERGVGLSGGQKQRLSIARALLKQPRILIFDEATSSLDAETAENFSRTINALRGKVTILFITHALPPGLRVDSVFRISGTQTKEMHVVQGEPQRASSA